MSKKLNLALIIILGSVILVALLLYSSKYDPARTRGRITEKLNSLNSVIFISKYDNESTKQLNEFAPYATNLNIIDCSDNIEYCEQQKIEDLPMIFISDIGIELVGFHSLEDLNNLFNQLEI